MNFLGSNLGDLDLVTILTAYLFLFYGQTSTAVFAFGQGLLIDLFSGGVHGLFTFLNLSAYGGIYVGSRFFDLQHPKSQMIIVSLTVLLKKLMFFIMVTLFYQNVRFSTGFLWVALTSAIVTGLIAPVLIYLFNFLRMNSLEDTVSASTERL